MPPRQVKPEKTVDDNDIADDLQMLAHELGHNWGMSHEFSSKHQGKGCSGGIMDYAFGTANSWSECSREDLQDHFNYFNDYPQHFVSSEWCLPGKEPCFMLIVSSHDFDMSFVFKEEPDACTEAAQPSPPENPVVGKQTRPW